MSAAKKKRLVFDVTPLNAGTRAGWNVRERRPRSLAYWYPSKRVAVAAGRRECRALLERGVFSQLVIHDGKGIQTEHTYGSDPRRTKG